jgi:hypothetical protein
METRPIIVLLTCVSYVAIVMHRQKLTNPKTKGEVGLIGVLE